MKTEYAWLSSKKITEGNVFERCTIIARSRWKIENTFLKEKHQGYSYSHCFSYNWNAMKGFHYLMKFGFFLNAIITFSTIFIERVQTVGIRGFVKTIWQKFFEGKWPSYETDEKKLGGSFSTKKYKIVYPSLIKG